MSRILLQQALDALKHHRQQTRPIDLTDATIEALEAELAKPEQEPEIVRRVKRYMGKRRETVGSPHITAKECIALANWIDSMLAAPPRKEWVGLTDEERNRFINYTGENFAAGVLWAEAKMRRRIMGLFKSGKSKADDLLSILIPSLEWQMREELKKRLASQMEDVVNEVATQVIGYGYDEAIKELTVKVRAPKREWVGLTDDEINKIANSPQPVDETSSGYVLPFAKAIQAKLKEKNGAL